MGKEIEQACQAASFVSEMEMDRKAGNGSQGWKWIARSILPLHLYFTSLHFIRLVQRRLRGQLINVLKYLNRFNNVSPRGQFEYDFNDRTRNIGKQ